MDRNRSRNTPVCMNELKCLFLIVFSLYEKFIIWEMLKKISMIRFCLRIGSIKKKSVFAIYWCIIITTFGSTYITYCARLFYINVITIWVNLYNVLYETLLHCKFLDRVIRHWFHPFIERVSSRRHRVEACHAVKMQIPSTRLVELLF